MPNPRFFATGSAFRAWLDANHLAAKELLVGYHRKDTGKPSMTWQQSVDQALCYGWIDGVRKRFNGTSYTIRFTPRRATSTWSAINIKRVVELTKLGLMRPAGLAAFARRSEKKSRTYAYEQRKNAALTTEQQRQFEANKRAWAFFTTQAPSYQRTVIHWVTSAKQPETRTNRLRKLIQQSAKALRL